MVVDEFPYLVEQPEALPSILQRVWDHTASETATTFVLTGSAIGMMYEYALDGSGPLYGRVTKDPNRRLDVGPLPFDAALSFFPAFDPAEQVMTYGNFGGSPNISGRFATMNHLKRTSRGRYSGGTGASTKNPRMYSMRIPSLYPYPHPVPI